MRVELQVLPQEVLLVPELPLPSEGPPSAFPTKQQNAVGSPSNDDSRSAVYRDENILHNLVFVVVDGGSVPQFLLVLKMLAPSAS